MATRKTETADVFAFPTFDPAKVTDSYRELTEKGIAQSKENYARLKTIAEDATKTLEATFENAQAGTVELGLKAVGMMRVNADNSLSHLEALLGVKSVAELLELQATFVRKQVELGVDQVKVLQEASRKIAEDVAKPVRAAADKAAGESKAA